MRGLPNSFVPCIYCPSLKGFPHAKCCRRCLSLGRGESPFTVAMDNRIREVWEKREALGRKGFCAAVAALTVELGLNRTQVHARAGALGVRVGTRRAWTAEDVRQLEGMAGLYSAHTIAKRMNRSFASVTCKMEELKIRATLLTGYTQDGLERLLGRSPETVRRLVNAGHLELNGDGRIPHSGVEAWLRRTALRDVDFTRVDAVWLRETLGNMLGGAAVESEAA